MTSHPCPICGGAPLRTASQSVQQRFRPSAITASWKALNPVVARF
ncbi:MAG TPA: hypothetical protein V6D14_17760 [Coleofasciculaceae cyanobacterium]